MANRKMVLGAIGVVAAVGLVAVGSTWLLWPKADNWTEEARACVTDKYAGYWESSGKYSFKLDYENACARKVTCAISVNISNANENVRDRAVLAFPARGIAPSARSYSVPVTSLVGMANASRNCRFA